MNTSADPAKRIAPASQPHAETKRFLKQYRLRLLAISAALLIPCFWHGHIEAGDLASHTYNAWLTQLAERGQAPGLWIAWQSSNVMFDVMLVRFANLAGLYAAERIAVSAAVLIFFWGTFALTSAFARRPAWFVIPCLAMFAYGWTFSQGFMNYYLSLGLAFGGLAVILGLRGGKRAWALVFLPLAWMAHPLGAALFVAAGAYILLTERLTGFAQWLLCAGAAALLFVLGRYAANHYQVIMNGAGLLGYLRLYNGADQLVLYSPRYRAIANALLVTIACAACADLLLGRHAEKSAKKQGDLPFQSEPLSPLSSRASEATRDLSVSRSVFPANWADTRAAAYILPAQLWLLALLAGFLLPRQIFLPQYAAAASLLTERLTLVAGIMACCVLGVARPRKWHLAVLASLAAIFFFLQYRDTAKIEKMEIQAERLVRTVPRGERIVATILPLPGSRVMIHHIVDRACIGYCFSFGDYEPSSGQFRLRVTDDNPYVIADTGGSGDIEAGDYVVLPWELPMSQIEQCGTDPAELCIRLLRAGEKTGGDHPRRP